MKEQGRIKLIYNIFMYSLLLKFILQLLSAAPLFLTTAFYSRDMMIGYIHLVMLGFITFCLFYLSVKNGLMSITGRVNTWGLGLFTGGFLFTELCLFINGLRLLLSVPVIPYYQGFLLIGAFFMLAGIGMIYVMQYKIPRTYN
jgi:hypothetical protein